MPVLRVTCDQCGLCATHIFGGGRGVTSLDADECEVRCQRGVEAKLAGESAVSQVATCEHLVAAVRSASHQPSRQR